MNSLQRTSLAATVLLVLVAGPLIAPTPVGLAHAADKKPKADNWQCAEMPDRNRACVNLAKRERKTNPNKSVSVVAPYGSLAPNDKVLAPVDHKFEVTCSGSTWLDYGLQDRNGTRYMQAGIALNTPQHTRMLADAMCAP